MSESAPISQICLECAAILRHLAVNDPVSAWDYTRAMMIKRILTTVLATVTMGAAGTSLALAQLYPQPPAGSYSRDPNYPPGGYPADYRDPRGAAPDFDALEDDQLPGQGSVALSPPGPVLSPEDPRYARPGTSPVYSDRSAPQGPILS